MSKLILHVDDEPAIREVIAASLEAEGYRVISAGSSAETLAALAQAQPDLVITDLQLDDGDGLDIISQLRTRIPTVPIILLTGVLVDPRVAQRSLANQVDLYLPKTSPLMKILEEVRRLAGK